MSECSACHRDREEFTRVKRVVARGPKWRRVCVACASKPRGKNICHKCGSLPWRVVGPRCRVCKLNYSDEKPASLWPKGRSSIAEMEHEW